MFLTESQKQRFEDRGFIVVKEFFGPAEMQQITAMVDDLRDAEPIPGEEAKYFEQSPITGEIILVRIEHILGAHNPGLTELLINPKVTHCLSRLMGEPPVLFKEKINFKLPGCRADKLHQDQAAGWSRYADFFITMAVIVDPNREDNAALSFMSSGNYKRGLMTEEWQPLTEDDPPYAPAGEYTLLEADPGDVVFFDAYVPHGSPPNTSDRSRRNIFLTFNRESDGDMRARYYADKWASYAPNLSDEIRDQDSFRV